MTQQFVPGVTRGTVPGVVRGAVGMMIPSVNLEDTVGAIRAARRRPIQSAIRAVVWAMFRDSTSTVICIVTRRETLRTTRETTDAVTYGRTLPTTDKTKTTAAEVTIAAAIAAARRELPGKDIGRCAWQRPSE